MCVSDVCVCGCARACDSDHVQGTASDGDKFSVRGDGLVTIAAGGLSVTAGGATVGGMLTSSSGVRITAGGLSVTAGGATISSSGTNTVSTSAAGFPALTVQATAASGYSSAVFSVSSGMGGAGTFHLIKVFFTCVRVRALALRCLGVCYVCFDDFVYMT